MGFRIKPLSVYSAKAARLYSGVTRNTHECKVLVVGNGAGGGSVSWRLFRKLKKNDIIVLEPSDTHYYQPLFTLVGAGIKKFTQSHRPQSSVLPPGVTWLKDRAEVFEPCNNVVYTSSGDKICYEYMVVALGLKNDYDQIQGLKEALDDPTRKVSTIYSSDYCVKTWCNIKQFQGGHAVFTFPQAQGCKCSGAAQKIMYLAHDYWKKNNILHLTNITYNTGGDAIFGVPKYAAALTRIACKRDLTVNCCVELVEVRKDGAVFVDRGGESITLPYNLLHVTPPMSPPTCLTKCDELVTNGYLDVDMYTLQHRTFSNIYGIGDCTSTPNSKTAAAVSHQSSVLERNILKTMSGKSPTAKYNGYGACPIVTSYGTGILAEFLYDKKVSETFPFDQSKERRIFYHLKKDIFPYLYWNKLMKGKWSGPSKIRRIINPFGK